MADAKNTTTAPAFALVEMDETEAAALNTRHRTPKISPFRDILAGATAGKTYKIAVEKDNATKVVSQLHTGAKQADLKIKVRNRADQGYVAVTLVGPAEQK